MASNLDLLPQHRQLIVESGINDEVAEVRGYRSVRARAELRRLGFSEPQARAPALLIPIHNVLGEVSLYQIRPDSPRIVDGKCTKYETPRGARMAIDVPPGARGWLGAPGRELFITEGARKADAAVSRELCCIALLGVWNWRGRNDDGGATALGDWECIHLKGRRVYIAFDSDVTTKPQVRGALIRLMAFLESRGASVKIILLPADEDGGKVGLDDFLAAGHTVHELLALASSEVPGSPPSQEDKHGYQATLDGLVYFKPTRDGSIPIRLTNFIATIVGDVSLDDGAEVQRALEVEASLDGRLVRLTVPTSQFSAMRWPIEHLGSGAVIYPGFSAADHARTAIQLLSGTAPRRSVYTHIGWREIGGTWVYLHDGGAIGEDGPVEGVEVRLRDPLARYRLPTPPQGEQLSRAIRSSFNLLRVAPLRVTVPIFCAIWRAVLGSTDITAHIAGPTGAFKTELASLVQRHFGAAMDARCLPGSWCSTANSLETTAFIAKDAVLVVDDFAPGGTIHDVQRFHRDADRLIRAQGNNAGRARMSSDCSLRASKPPRGLILSTGEDTPRGHSLRARMVIVEVGPSDVDRAKLSACQRDAEAGLYAEAMAGFLRHLAPRYPAIRDALRARVLTLRDSAGSAAGHLRTPESVANLMAGFEVFLGFAKEAGALTAEEAKALWTEAWRALQDTAAAQRRYHAQVEPARRFVELLGSALASGRCHVAGTDGEVPHNAEAWGWREATVGVGEHQRTEWRARGDRIGWMGEDGVYLDPPVALAAAQRLSEDIGEPLSVTSSTLHRRLNERGFLASTDRKRETLLVRRNLAGSRRYVVHLRLSALSPAIEPAQPAQGDEERAEPPEWAGSWAGAGQANEADPPTKEEPNPPGTQSNFSSGQVGQVSTPLKATQDGRPDTQPGSWAGSSANLPANLPTQPLSIRGHGKFNGGPVNYVLEANKRRAASDRAEAQRLRRLGREVEAKAFEQSADEAEERAAEAVEETDPWTSDWTA